MINFNSKSPLWIAITVLLGALTGAGMAVYLPAWVLIFVTFALVMLGLVSLFSCAYFGGAWPITLIVMIFNVPMWITWAIVYLYEITKTLQSFP